MENTASRLERTSEVYTRYTPQPAHRRTPRARGARARRRFRICDLINVFQLTPKQIGFWRPIWSLSRGRVPRPVSGFPACPAVLYVEGTYPCHCPGPGLRRSRRWTAHTPSACDSAEATDGARRVLSAPASAVRVLQERDRSVVSRSHGIASVVRGAGFN